jgi:energy-coupling factor transporter ATP-binding protein EcfA2
MVHSFGLSNPQQVAATAPDKKFRFKDAFPLPGVILMMGKRGSGKSSTAMWAMEEIYKHTGGRIGGAVLKAPSGIKKLLPSWVATPNRIKNVPTDSVVIIDEAQQMANARRSSSNDNLDLAQLVALSRQRNQLIILISHHSRKLDMNDVMDASRIIWKLPAAGQVMFERKEIKPFSQRAVDKFAQRKGNPQKVAYVMDFEDLQFGFASTGLASFWSEALSTGYSGPDLGAMASLFE